MEHKFGVTKPQFPKKVDGVQSSINKTSIALKEIGS
jgi:hypothetical protein